MLNEQLLFERSYQHLLLISKNLYNARSLFGGADLISSLMDLQLVDEIILAVHPVILGSGKALFKDIKERTWLTLTDQKFYSNGLVFLTYTVNR